MLGFPGGSEVKASAYNAGDPLSIPGSGRSPGEGNGCRGFSCCGACPQGKRASVVASHGLGSGGSPALEHRLSNCGAWV